MGHSLHPLVPVADHGLKPTVIEATNEALETHQLIKIRMRGKDKQEMTLQLDELCQKTGAQLISTIGFIALIYKRNPDKPPVQL